MNARMQLNRTEKPKTRMTHQIILKVCNLATKQKDHLCPMLMNTYLEGILIATTCYYVT